MTTSYSNIYCLLCSLLLAHTVCIVGGCSQEQAPDSISKDLPLQLQDSTEYYKYEVRFPAAIRYRSNTPIREELQQYTQDQKQDFLSFFEQDSIPETATYPWELLLEFTVKDSTDLFISILGQGYTYTGGAHGNHFYKMINYDQHNQRLIQLTDLFADSTSLQPISEFSRKVISQKLAEQYTEAQGSPEAIEEQKKRSSEWINDGTTPKFSFFQHFLLAEPNRNGRPTGLRFFFPPYQVAPYAAGTQEVFVPVSVFEDHLKPEARKLF